MTARDPEREPVGAWRWFARCRLLLLATFAGAALVGQACGGGPSEAPRGPSATAPATATVSPVPSESPAAGSTPTGRSSAALPDTTAPTAGTVNLGTRSGVETTARDPAFQPLADANGYHGRLGSAVYRIELPSGWRNGPLVLWAHGFRGFGTELSVSSPPTALRRAVIASGYAWAASSYSENGYAPGVGADDTVALLRFFEQQFGAPSRVVIAGESMGGNVTVLALEHYDGEFAGGLSFCGAVGGARQLDYLVSWALLAEYLSGVRLPIGVPGALVLPVILQISAVLGSPGAFTAEGRRFESAIRELTGGPRPFFAEGLADQYVTNFGLLIADPERKTVGVAAATNASEVYEVDPTTGVTAAGLNAGIRRLAPVPAARDAAAHPDAVPTSGRLSAPLLTLHNTGDLFVPISLEVEYRTVVESLGLGDRLVQRAIRDGGHCRFSDQEYVTAWRDFRAWIEDGTRPAGELLGDDLSDAGRLFTQPLRAGDPGGR